MISSLLRMRALGCVPIREAELLADHRLTARELWSLVPFAERVVAVLALLSSGAQCLGPAVHVYTLS